jgi:hypothetical protein
MPEDVSRRSILFEGCARESTECDAARFAVIEEGRPPLRVEVRITAQIESILAREMGKRELTEQEREAILSLAGRRLIEECLRERGRVDPLLFLTSQLFREPGAERRLLRECGLI